MRSHCTQDKAFHHEKTKCACMTTSSWNKLLWGKTMKTSRSSKKATMEIMEMLVVYH